MDLHTTFRNPMNFIKRGTSFIYSLKAIKCFKQFKNRKGPKKVIFQKQNSFVKWLFTVPFKKLITYFYKVYFPAPTCDTL